MLNSKYFSRSAGKPSLGIHFKRLLVTSSWSSLSLIWFWHITIKFSPFLWSAPSTCFIFRLNSPESFSSAENSITSDTNEDRARCLVFILPFPTFIFVLSIFKKKETASSYPTKALWTNNVHLLTRVFTSTPNFTHNIAHFSEAERDAEIGVIPSGAQWCTSTPFSNRCLAIFGSLKIHAIIRSDIPDSYSSHQHAS